MSVNNYASDLASVKDFLATGDYARNKVSHHVVSITIEKLIAEFQHHFPTHNPTVTALVDSAKDMIQQLEKPEPKELGQGERQLLLEVVNSLEDELKSKGITLQVIGL